MNVITVSGNLTRDANTREVGSTTVTGFSVANNVGWGDKKQVNYYDCSMWGKQGERLSDFLKLGKSVIVSGELTTREYEGKKYLQIEVKSFDFAGDSKQSQAPDENNSDTGEDTPF